MLSRQGNSLPGSDDLIDKLMTNKASKHHTTTADDHNFRPTITLLLQITTLVQDPQISKLRLLPFLDTESPLLQMTTLFPHPHSSSADNQTHSPPSM